jgi:hypothetical protein
VLFAGPGRPYDRKRPTGRNVKRDVLQYPAPLRALGYLNHTPSTVSARAPWCRRQPRGTGR